MGVRATIESLKCVERSYIRVYSICGTSEIARSRPILPSRWPYNHKHISARTIWVHSKCTRKLFPGPTRKRYLPKRVTTIGIFSVCMHVFVLRYMNAIKFAIRFTFNLSRNAYVQSETITKQFYFIYYFTVLLNVFAFVGFAMKFRQSIKTNRNPQNLTQLLCI